MSLFSFLSGHRNLLHRLVSTVWFSVCVAFAYSTMHPGISYRLVGIMLLPMACVWFPEALGQFDKSKTSSPLGETSYHPLLVRFFGWLLLVLFPVVFALIFPKSP